MRLRHLQLALALSCVLATAPTTSGCSSDSTGGTAANGCTIVEIDAAPACNECAAESCCDEVTKCADTDGCVTCFQCWNSCNARQGANCQEACCTDAQAAAFGPMVQCVNDACFPQTCTDF
jgi:hypothetical protein